ncbi:MAG: hypothetical protein J2P19_00100 [Pseudonocardia sp.]|nr:hypothetical protein [Pseudonocardia sp.]
MANTDRACGSRHTLLGRERVCARQTGHEPPHRDAGGAEWIAGPEIADTGYADLEQYLAEHDAAVDEQGAAAAAWLHERTGWDGRVERVDEPDDPDEAGRG